ITIDGVETLHGTQHRIIPDRIETATFMVAAAVTHGDITLTDADPDTLEMPIQKLRDAGILIDFPEPGRIRIQAPDPLRPVDLETCPYPGFPTDLQAQMLVLNSLAQGVSRITETVFENRFMHVSELQRLGADIRIHGNLAEVHGVEQLLGAPVMATDLRASASLVLAGLAAHGATTISRVYHIDRGYERIEEKLHALGADIQRTSC
ncbi:MAG: UDP-N-acetylglucosamine 1-carboxyvinyltransferase, partial [Magnetococcales bacterium]|nr:UDP-N-acetylglucosamine 1-carboxyvinyltransferase [Magnetococcales bacterium]